MATKAKKRASSSRSAAKTQSDKPQTQDPSDPGTAYGEPVRVGLATGSRASSVLPERNAPSRDTQTVTPVADGPSTQGGGPYNEN